MLLCVSVVWFFFIAESYFIVNICFILFDKYLGVGLHRSQVRSILSFIRNCHILFYISTSDTSVPVAAQPYQYWLLSVFLILTILVGMWWLWSECLEPHWKLECWNPTTKVMLLEGLGHKGGTLIKGFNGISAFIKEALESSLVLSTMWGYPHLTMLAPCSCTSNLQNCEK